jgi:hypothetical protein
MAEATTQTEKLPALPAELTPEWFGSKLGHKVKSVENTRNIWGTASKLFYTITYEDEAAAGVERPEHVCVKGVFDPKTIAEQPWTVSLAIREADFFSKIAPTLENVTFPRGWWSGNNDVQGIAIMDDLTKFGCDFPPEAAAYSVDKVMSGVESLAGLHAKYWGQSQEDHPCECFLLLLFILFIFLFFFYCPHFPFLFPSIFLSLFSPLSVLLSLARPLLS